MISRAQNPKYLKIIIIAKADKVNVFQKRIQHKEKGDESAAGRRIEMIGPGISGDQTGRGPNGTIKEIRNLDEIEQQ